MNLGDLIYSMITLVLMVLVISSPILRKVFRSAKIHREGKDHSSEDSVYESVDSRKVIDRMLEENEPPSRWKIKEPDTIVLHKLLSEKEKKPASERVEALSSLKKAVIWSEILGKPLSLRRPDDIH